MRFDKEKNILKLFLFLFWIPLFFWIANLYKEKPLYGAYVPRNKPVFVDSLWFSGKYQEMAEGYINDSIAFRNFFVRFRNQVDYTFFNKTHAIDNFVGKEGNLVAESHLDFYYGKTGQWPTSLEELGFKLKKLQDTMEREGKTLLIAIAPNKGFTYPEMAPFWYQKRQAQSVNDYEAFVKNCRKNRVKTIDFQNWFYGLKQNVSEPLYPWGGVHWTQFLATQALDSLVKHVGFLRSEKLPSLIRTGVEVVDTPRYSDNDMEKLLNLLTGARKDKYQYQKFRIDTTGKKKIDLALISDSYGFSWFFENQVQQVFNKWSNWYYFKRVDSNQPSHGKSVSQVSLQEQIKLHDVFVILSTGTNLSEIGWGFIQKAYDLYFDPRMKKVNEWMEKIRNDKSFFEQIERKAREANIDVEAQLYFDAYYQAEEEEKRAKSQ